MFEKRWTSSIALLLSGTFHSRGIRLMLGASILLSILGWGDQDLPGRLYTDQGGSYIEAARSYGASSANSNGALYEGLYYWVLEPAVLLMFTGLAFALLGFALDRIFNPRLRGL